MWADVCTRPNGQTVGIRGDGQRVEIVALPSGELLALVSCPAVHLRVAALDTRVIVAGQSLVGYQVLVVTDHGAAPKTFPDGPGLDKHDPLVPHGPQSIAIHQVGGDHVSLSWVSHAGTRLTSIALDADLREVSAMAHREIPATSQGLLDSHPVVLTDASLSVMLDGIRYGLPMSRGRYTIGQDYDGRYGVPGVLAYDLHAARHLRVWEGYSPTPPRLAVRPDGSAVAAISAGAGVFVESSAWEALAAPVWTDEPPAFVPSFPVTTHPIAVRVMGEPGDPGDYEFCTVGPSAQAEDPDEAIARAEARGVMTFLYWDASGVYPEAVDTLARAAHVAAVNVYPVRLADGTMEPIDVTVARADACLAGVVSPRKALVFALYRQIKQVEPTPIYNWPLQHVLDLLPHVWALARTHRVDTLLGFVYERGHGRDGLVSRAEFAEAVARMRAAVQPAPPVPDPIPDPIPVPDEDVMPLLTEVEFDDVATHTAAVLQKYFAFPDEEFIHWKQSVLSAGDRPRGRGRNPSAAEIAYATIITRPHIREVDAQVMDQLAAELDTVHLR